MSHLRDFAPLRGCGSGLAEVVSVFLQIHWPEHGVVCATVLADTVARMVPIIPGRLEGIGKIERF